MKRLSNQQAARLFLSEMPVSDRVAIATDLLSQIINPGMYAELRNHAHEIARHADCLERKLRAAARRSALQSEALGVAATAAALYHALRPAVEFESAMSGIRRVVDFDAPDGMAQLQRDILELTTSGALPMAAEGIASVIASAGQAGIIDGALPDEEERRQLLAFARDAARMGTAFEIAAENAGGAMALWRGALGMTRIEAMGFGDAINHLSNNMDATAPEIVEMVRRSGAFVQAAGLASTSTVALSAALLAGGAAPQVAATGMQNLITAMTAGAAVTDDQREIFQSLGLDAEEMAERMQVDAQGAIYDVMAALAELPDHTQISALSRLFGRESADAIAPLLANLGLLEQAFGLVADPAEYAGSMLAEFEAQSATTANMLRLTANFMARMAITAGSVLLPEINALLATLQPMIQMVTEWAAAHPELITLLFRVTLGMLAFRAASIALRWGLLSSLVPILQLIRGGSWLIALLPRVAAGLLALLNPLAWVRGAVWATKMAFMATGIGLLLAGIAAAGLWIYNNWAGLKTFFVNLWGAFRDALGPVSPMLDGIVETMQTLWNWVSDLLGPLDDTQAEWAEWGETTGTALGGATAAVMEWISTNQGLAGLLAKIMGVWIALRAIWVLPMAPFRLVAKIIGFLLGGPFRLLLTAVGGLGSAFVTFGAMVASSMGGAVTIVANAVSQMLSSFALLRFATPLAAFYAGLGVTGTGDGTLPEHMITEGSPLSPEADLQRNVIAMGAVPEGMSPEIENALTLIQGMRREQDLPTLERRAELEGVVADIRGEMAGIQAEIDNLGQGPMADAMAIPMRQSMAVISQDLAQAEADLAAVDARAADLTAALQVLDATNVAPVIDAVHIQRALTAALALDRTLEGLPQNGTTPNPHSSDPRRDAGGPVRAGQPYLVGERGPELFMPTMSGTILPGRALRAAMAASAMVASTSALPAAADMMERIDTRPALSMSAPAQNSTRIEVGQIVIQAAPGMDPAAIGREVRRQLQALQDDRRGDLHDGVDY